MVHKTLKGGWCISESKWHDYELKMPMMSLEGCFRDIRFLHPDLIVSIL